MQAGSNCNGKFQNVLPCIARCRRVASGLPLTPLSEITGRNNTGFPHNYLSVWYFSADAKSKSNLRLGTRCSRWKSPEHSDPLWIDAKCTQLHSTSPHHAHEGGAWADWYFFHAPSQPHVFSRPCTTTAHCPMHRSPKTTIIRQKALGLDGLDCKGQPTPKRSRVIRYVWHELRWHA